MKYLLDTCVVSDFIKGDKNTMARLKNTPPTEIVVSTITVMEIHYGLSLNAKLAKNIKPVIMDFLTPITILNFCQSDAEQAAFHRARLKQQGSPIGSYDILLAGIALNHKLIMVSANTKEFNRITGLHLENWRL